MAKKSKAPTGSARYIARASISWEVVRLNEDGSETIYSLEKTENKAKTRAAKLDARARRGREQGKTLLGQRAS
jgi:hypothetical protein